MHHMHVLHGEEWGVTICRSSLPVARGCRVGVWFGFVGAALLPAVGSCVVLAFGAMPGRCCSLRVTRRRKSKPSNNQEPAQRAIQYTVRFQQHQTKPDHNKATQQKQQPYIRCMHRVKRTLENVENSRKHTYTKPIRLQGQLTYIFSRWHCVLRVDACE